MEKCLLAIISVICAITTANAGKLTYQATSIPAVWGGLTATKAGGIQVASGDEVNDGTEVSFTAPNGVGYHIDWYVNGEKSAVEGNVDATGCHFAVSVTGETNVEARYVEHFKLIFKDTPFVKYADKDGYVFVGANFYHHKPPVDQYGGSVSEWTNEKGTKYLVDNNPLDTIFRRMKLEADSVMTPTFLANDDDLGDASGLAVWDFTRPDSIALFNNFKGKCYYMMPTDLKAAYVDVAMVCDATEGLIDNSTRLLKGNTRVDAGTRFRLPSLYGTIFKITGTNEFNATMIDGEAPEKGMQGELHTASLTILDATKDSVDIIIGEDQYLTSISANYPGGYTTMAWRTNIGKAETSISTVSKTADAGILLFNLTDIAQNGGLAISPNSTVIDTLTTQIEITPTKEEAKYLSVGFEVAEDFSLMADSVIVPICPIVGTGNNNKCKVELLIEDEYGHKLDSIFSTVTADSLCHFAMVAPKNSAIDNPTALYLYGKVTVKCWVYGIEGRYGLGSPIVVNGTMCETITCGEGQTWAPYVTKGGLNLEKLTGLSVYKVSGVNEKKLCVILEQMEEMRKGQVSLINTAQPGAVYNSPLTRADDSMTQNSILFVSDGTVTGDKTRYVFAQNGTAYTFSMVPEGDVIPEGDVYLEWETFTEPQYLYLNQNDVPTAITTIDITRKLATGETYTIMRNGRMYIVKPDGSVYNLSGAKIM